MKMKLHYFFLFTPFVLIAVFLHHKASSSFPIPWSDESAFLYQAVSFQESSSLYAPELNQNRSIFWMPPGYMILMGTIFKISGFSIDIARSLSLVFFITTFTFIVLIMQKYKHSMLSTLICGLILINQTSVITSNTARMEPLLLLIVMAGFFLLNTEKYYGGLALISISPLIHPNGCYFLLATCIYFIGNIKAIRHKKISRTDKFFISMSCLLWIGYFFYIGFNWSNFLFDMSYQFTRKGKRGILGKFPKALPILIALSLCYIYASRMKLKTTFMFYIAVPALIINRVGREMWYQVYDNIFAVFFALIALDIVSTFLEYGAHIKNTRLIKFAKLLFALLLLAAYFEAGFINSPKDYCIGLKWVGMKMQDDVPYITNSDIKEVKEFINNNYFDHDEKLIIQIYPRGDAILFYDHNDREKKLFSQPLFSRKTPHLYLIHRSKYIPNWMNSKTLGAFKYANIDPLNKKYILLQRDETEIWYYRMNK